MLLRAVGVTFGNLDNARIKLPAVQLDHPFYSRVALTGRLIRVYRNAALREAWKILGSADILGDPVGLFTDLSTGFTELFYEPAQGIVAGTPLFRGQPYVLVVFALPLLLLLLRSAALRSRLKAVWGSRRP